MWKMICRVMRNIFLFVFIEKVSHYGGRSHLSFTKIKFDIILMDLKIPT